jgi:hypothetical protein
LPPSSVLPRYGEEGNREQSGEGEKLMEEREGIEEMGGNGRSRKWREGTEETGDWIRL